MSHTSRFEVDDGTATITHNSDWAGVARVMWATEDGEGVAEIPGALLVELGVAVAFDYLRSEITGALESLGRPPFQSATIKPKKVRVALLAEALTEMIGGKYVDWDDYDRKDVVEAFRKKLGELL